MLAEVLLPSYLLYIFTCSYHQCSKHSIKGLGPGLVDIRYTMLLVVMNKNNKQGHLYRDEEKMFKPFLLIVV